MMFEKYPVTDSRCSCFHNIDVEALVMLHRHPNVEPSFGMGVPCSSVLRFYVCHHCASQGGKGALHVVVLPMNMRIGRDFGSDVALPTVSLVGLPR